MLRKSSPEHPRPARHRRLPVPVGRALLCLLLALLPSACAGPSATAPRDAASPAPWHAEAGITYQIAVRPPEAGARLDICATVASPGTPLPSPLRFAFPDQWGGRTGFLDDVGEIEAFDATGSELSVAFDPAAVATVAHSALDRVRFCYRVRPVHRIASEASRFRALLSASRLYAPGHAVFAVPLAVAPQLHHAVRVVASDDSSGAWALRASLPLDGTPLRMRQWHDAFLFAGPWREATAGVEGRATTVFIDPALDLDPQAVAQRVQRVVDSQAGLLDLRIARSTAVLVLRRDDDPTAMTGNGREGGFVLELGDDVAIDGNELIELAAHENLHRLIGHSLTFAENEELATLWFREGLTDYVAVRQAVAAGLLPSHRLFLRIGNALTHYRGNPAASVDGDAVSAEQYWESRDLRRLPYDKGTLLALLIDLGLRQSGGGDLVGWIAFLRDDASARMLPLTNAALRDSLERYSGRSWTGFWSSYVLGTEPLPVHEALRSAGIEVVERLQPAPWFGLRVGATSDGRWFIASVAPGSPAETAGLRVGLNLAGEPWIPTDPGTGSARILLGDDVRSSRTVVVPPGRGQRRAYVLRALDDSDEAYLAHFGLGDGDAR